MNYRKYMSGVIETFPIGIPIFTESVVKMVSDDIGEPIKKIKSMVNLNLKRLADNCIIERIQKGVYYKPEMTAFGKIKPPMELVIMETCLKQGGKRIGYIGAEMLLHNLGLTTLVPKNKVIVTNKYRMKVPKENHLILKKPVTKVTEENVKYLQLIDAISMLDMGYIDAENPCKIMRQTIDELQLDKLMMIEIAKKYYPHRVLMAVLDIILEDDYEVTRG